MLVHDVTIFFCSGMASSVLRICLLASYFRGCCDVLVEQPNLCGNLCIIIASADVAHRYNHMPCDLVNMAGSLFSGAASNVDGGLGALEFLRFMSSFVQPDAFPIFVQ